MKQILTRMLPVLALFTSGLLNAQTPFWTQDFAGGIPAGWGNTDGSGQNILWTWCNDPEAGNGVAGCPGVFGGQDPFKSFTPTNGFVTVDSDEAQQLANNHVSRLTSTAIDCSGKSKVFISFATQIGVYTVSAETGAILRVSTDNTTWTNYTIFPGVSTSVGWSKNPETPIIDISATAANKSTVYLRWEWTGNWEYIWNLDDVNLYDSDPTPVHNLVLGDFFFPASSLAQPASQIATDTFGSFFTYVSNPGLVDETNVVVKVAVNTDTGEEIYSSSVTLPSLSVGVVDSVIEIPGSFAPELPVGDYEIVYSVSSDSTDDRPFDYAVGNPFYVTNGIYSKENGGYAGYRPSGGGDWAVGALYRTTAGSLDQYMATTAQFAFAADGDPTEVEATIYLMRVKDDVDAGFSNFDDVELISPSIDLVGFGAYQAPDTADNYLLQSVDLLDFLNQTNGVVLDPGARYFLMVSYTGASNTTYHAFNLDVKMFFISTVTFSDQWYLGGFGEEFNAAARLGISLVVTTDNKPLPETSMTVFPNPVHSTLNMGVNFDKPTDATITIADVTGRVIQVEDRQALTQDVLTYQLPQLASGTYLARIATADGTLTRKFVVQK